MKIRTTKDKRKDIEVPMTPMIDIVFQLLVFFIMTFKIVASEADFNIKLPDAASNAPPSEEIIAEVIKVFLRSNDDGELVALHTNTADFGSGFSSSTEQKEALLRLRSFVMEKVGTQTAPQEEEEDSGWAVEINADYNLKYTYTIEAVSMVSGWVENDNVIHLIDNIKFARPQNAPDPGS